MGQSAASSSSLSKLATAQRFAQALLLVPELGEVEHVIRKSFQSDVAAMREIPEYLLSLGGKRIRPALTLLCAKALGTTVIPPEIINVAAGIELIHMATLMHDDIVDESPIRRHKKSPYAKYGTALTLLSGDFLLTRAFGLCAKLDDEVISATEQACLSLVEGEALETTLCREPHTKESSITIAQRKTASLFTLATFCAAHLSAAPPPTVQSLSTFGEKLGIAFQIIDDILDVLADEETLGKRPGLDIAERKPSIVNVLWLASGDPEAQRLLQPPGGDDESLFVQRSLASLRDNSEAVRAAQGLAKHFAGEAKAALGAALASCQQAPNTAQEALFTIIDFALERAL